MEISEFITTTEAADRAARRRRLVRSHPARVARVHAAAGATAEVGR